MSSATLEQPAAFDTTKLPLVPQVAQKDKPIMRFELLFGRHEERNPKWKPTHQKKDSATGVMIPVMLNEDGDEVPENLMYVRGDIVETTVDLLRAIDHNSGRNGVKKFKRVEGDPIGELRKAQEAVAADPIPGIAVAAVDTRWTIDKLNSKSLRDLQLICSEAKLKFDAGDRKDRLISLIMGQAK
jgi:hypothetical protein